MLIGFGRFIAAIALLTLMAVSPDARAGSYGRNGGLQPDGPGEAPYPALAEEILAGIEASAIAAQLGKNLRIAVWPYRSEDAPFPAALANEYNAKLMAALIARGGHRYRFVAREALWAVAREVSESAASEDEIQEVLAALVESAQADVLVVGTLRASRHDRVVLSYKAIDVTGGALLAVTSHQSLHLPPAELRAAERAVTLDLALRRAARHLGAQAADLRRLHLAGIRNWESGTRTPLSRYLEARAGAALQAAAAESPFGGGIVVISPGVEGPRPTAPGQDGMPGEFNAAGLPSGSYALQGSYWYFGESIELQLSLRDANSVVASWRERVRAKSLPVGLRPAPAIAENAPSRPRVAAPAPDRRRAEVPQPGGHGPTSRQVVGVQEELFVLGYYSGPIDGSPGPRTRVAVRDYQRAAGLPRDGEIDEGLIAQLRRSRTLGLHRARRAPALPRSGPDYAKVPAGHLPPPGRCRIWHPDRSAGHQPPPGSCDVMRRRVPAGSWLITSSGRRLNVRLAAAGGRIVDRSGAGRGSDWRHGAYGPGGRCREFARRVTIGGRSEWVYGIACQRPDGSWQFARR